MVNLKDERSAILNKYWATVKSLQAQIDQAALDKDAEISELEAKCLRVNGTHVDDGSMFHSWCANCGAGNGA